MAISGSNARKKDLPVTLDLDTDSDSEDELTQLDKTVGHHEEVCTVSRGCCTGQEVDQCVGQLLAHEYVRHSSSSSSILDRDSILKLQAKSCCLLDKGEGYGDLFVGSHSDIYGEVMVCSSQQEEEREEERGILLSNSEVREDNAYKVEEHMLSYVDSSPPPCTLQVSSSG